MGNHLRLLGLYPKRDSQGYGVVLDDDLRRQIQRLPHDYQPAVEQAVTSCKYSAEIMEVA
jgi:hypothetical protein